MKRTTWVTAPFFVLLVACSASHPGSAGTSTTTPANTTTTPAVHGAAAAPCTRTLTAVPAERVPPGVAHGRPVVGSGALWTIAAAVSLHGDHQTRGWVIKMPWITRPFGIPAITAHRLDGAGTFRVIADEAIDQNGKWVASNLIFSTAGCWEITGRFHGSTLRFETRIGAPDPIASGS